MDVQGKVVLIAGGGTGLGRVIARHLAQAGMHVAVGYSRSEHDASGRWLQSVRSAAGLWITVR